MTDTKERILSTAVRIFLERGFRGLSMRRIGEQSGITGPAIYRHFRDKEDLVMAIIQEALTAFTDYLAKALGGKDPMERLRMTGEGYLHFALENPSFYQIVTAPPDLFGEDGLPEDVLDRERTPHRFLMDRLRECIEEGLIAEDDPESLSLTVWAISHGLITLFHSGRIKATREEFEELYWASLQRLYAGLQPRPGIET